MASAMASMTETLSQLKLPYVDYSNPESIANNLSKFNMISDMISDFSQHTFDSFKTVGRNMNNNTWAITQMTSMALFPQGK